MIARARSTLIVPSQIAVPESALCSSHKTQRYLLVPQHMAPVTTLDIP